MKKILNIGLLISLVSVCALPIDGFAATKTKKQSALQVGTKVRTKIEANGVYDQECYEKYYGCMDQFCIADNENGGTCVCSDDAAVYEAQLEEIKKTLAEAERISTEEVEKIQAGARADIIFNGGERIYNDDGSVVKAGEEKKSNQIKFSSIYDFEEDEEDIWDDNDLSNLNGRQLYNSAHDLCVQQMPDSCSKDMTLLTQMYSRQIVSDCKGLANSIAQKKQEADAALAQAKAAVRGALKNSFDEANQYDRGTCMVEYKKCMMSNDACGSDWGKCVFTIASENMQNNAATSVAGTKVKTINTYDITASTMEILESKRFICEKVLDKCVAARDYVWNDFLREAAPTIRLAESNIESQKRQSCLGDISACIQKACRDDIAGKGEATMDACLARPDMARSFCKIQIDPCERMEPQIWDYVVSKLAAMRVDACTAEVKECFTSEDRCGADFSNCIGMDFDYIHSICPIDKLVVCKQANPNFKMKDLDSMLMGLYLNIDNKALENCQNLVEKKMLELCGSTTDCNAFAADEFIGTNSIRSQKDGTTYRVTGMISFGSIKMGDATGKNLKPGEISVDDYINNVNSKGVPSGMDSKQAEAIISSIKDELNNIAGTINRTISLIESDQQIQYCINGRDLSQINGKGSSKDNTTTARFPNLLNQYRVAIAMSALRKAQDNYNKKLNEAISEATKDASADVAQYMCQKMGEMGTRDYSLSTISTQDTLTAPYSISYDVGSGLSTNALLKGGYGSITQGGETFTYRDRTSKNSGMYMESRATFDRSTRTCHICTTTTTTSCKNITKYFKSESDCNVSAGQPVCEDVKM